MSYNRKILGYDTIFANIIKTFIFKKKMEVHLIKKLCYLWQFLTELNEGTRTYKNTFMMTL